MMPNETMQRILEKYPWIKEDNQKLIISPDSDGFLSALLLMNYFNAEVVGYYDGKVMLCDKDTDPKECTFIDLDIYCQDIKSVGHHMVCYNRDKKPENWRNYNNCIQLNNLRNFDSYHDFQKKYPFATIHFLISLLENERDISLSPQAIAPLLFCDGVFNNLFGYPENCLDWLKWLNADNEETLLHDIFYENTPFSDLMQTMDAFFKKRDEYNTNIYFDFEKKEEGKSGNGLRTGHHMIISRSNGTPANIVENGDAYDVFDKEKERTLGFIGLMADFIGWNVIPEKWAFSNMKLYRFKKERMSASVPTHLNLRNYTAMTEGNCFSMAITAGSTIEYTRDVEGHFRT